MTTRESLAANLKRFLRREKLNQTAFLKRFRQLPDVPRCSRSHFSRVMKGTRVPNLDLLDAFAVVLNVRTAELLGDPTTSQMSLDRFESALVACVRQKHNIQPLLQLLDCEIEELQTDSHEHASL